MAEVGAAEVGPGKVRTPEAGEAEEGRLLGSQLPVGAARRCELGAGEVGVVQIGAEQRRSLEVGQPQIGIGPVLVRVST
jgi:hypothetical protein